MGPKDLPLDVWGICPSLLERSMCRVYVLSIRVCVLRSGSYGRLCTPSAGPCISRMAVEAVD